MMGKYSGKTCRLLTMLGMTSSFFLVEIIVGYVTSSIALVADSFHILSYMVALIVGYAAVRISKLRSQKNTFGLARAEVLGALVNSCFLIALCLSICVDTLKRLTEIEKIENPKLLLIVGGVGLLINLIGLALFHNQGRRPSGCHCRCNRDQEKGGSKNVKENGSLFDKLDNEISSLHKRASSGDSERGLEDINVDDDGHKVSSGAQLNIRAVFLHVLGNAFGSVTVVTSALVIWFVDKDWVYYVDPGMSIIMVGIIFSTTIPLLKEAALILLQAVPTHIKLTDIKDNIMKIDGIQAVSEFYVWQLAGNSFIASVHIRCHNPHAYITIVGKVKDLFHKEGIRSTTIQPDFSENVQCSGVLACEKDNTCNTDTCCSVPKKSSPDNTENGSAVWVYRSDSESTAQTECSFV